MTAENHVYFRRTGSESHGFVLIRLLEVDRQLRAEASIAGPMTEGADQGDMPLLGEPHGVLRNAREAAAVRGLDVRIQLDGVEWNPELGSLVGK